MTGLKKLLCLLLLLNLITGACLLRSSARCAAQKVELALLLNGYQERAKIIEAMQSKVTLMLGVVQKMYDITVQQNAEIEALKAASPAPALRSQKL